MKKIIFTLLMILTLSGCASKEEDNQKDNKEIKTILIEEIRNEDIRTESIIIE